MPRRLVTSDIFLNDKVAELSDGAKLLFIGMITNADDEGRGKAKPKFLKAHIFPYDEDKNESTILSFRDEIVTHQLAKVYNFNNEDFYWFPSWEEHQIIRKDRFKKSQLPPPSDNHTPTNCQPDDNQLSTDLASNQTTTSRQPADNISQVKSSQVNISKYNISQGGYGGKGLMNISDNDLTDKLTTLILTNLSGGGGKNIIMSEITTLWRQDGKKIGQQAFQIFYDALEKYSPKAIAETICKVVKYGEGKKNSANYIKTILDEKEKNNGNL